MPPSFSPALIDKDDLWFLDVVSELSTSLAMLLGPEDAVALNMRRGHGLSVEALARKLASLSARGLIQVSQSAERGEEARTQAEIARALAVSRDRGPEVFFYRLTALGGVTWEHYARPDWRLYLSAWTDFDSRECRIEASSCEAAEAEYRRHGVNGSGEQPVDASKRGEDVVPWRATYWKVLPSGYRLRYAWIPRPQDVAKTIALSPSAPWYSPLALDG
jgi:hypothetical protein